MGAEDGKEGTGITGVGLWWRVVLTLKYDTATKLWLPLDLSSQWALINTQKQILQQDYYCVFLLLSVNQKLLEMKIQVNSGMN